MGKMLYMVDIAWSHTFKAVEGVPSPVAVHAELAGEEKLKAVLRRRLRRIFCRNDLNPYHPLILVNGNF